MLAFLHKSKGIIRPWKEDLAHFLLFCEVLFCCRLHTLSPCSPLHHCNLSSRPFIQIHTPERQSLLLSCARVWWMSRAGVSVSYSHSSSSSSFTVCCRYDQRLPVYLCSVCLPGRKPARWGLRLLWANRSPKAWLWLFSLNAWIKAK